jgi:hypothetical protein
MTLKQQSSMKICDKRRFLIAAMEELSGRAYISFEGDLNVTKLADMPGASQEESLVLKRNTLWPKQDFLILPLELDLVHAISVAIGGTVPKAILHIQIEKDCQLELGLYDNFQHSIFGAKLNPLFFERLQSDRIVKQLCGI